MNGSTRAQLLFPQICFTKLFLKLRYTDIVAVCRKNREAGQITPLTSLTRNYIA